VGTNAPETPFATAIDANTGSASGLTSHYEKVFADLSGVYQQASGDGSISEGDVAYEVFSTPHTVLPGALTVGTSIVKPGRIGDEFALTRGHLHRIADRAEMYFGLHGHGVMLLENVEGDVHALDILPGHLVYVPGGWIHRSVNVGSELLVTLFCYSADSGQNYDIVEQSGGMKKLVVDDGRGGWMLRDNPRYVPRVPS
jgi:glucose-6-phosphate isomerase